MNILIAVPGVSHSMFSGSKFLNGNSELLDPVEFKPTGRTLDVFPQEMKGMFVAGFWGIGIPHWPMAENGTHGVAGPGLPKEELYVPESIAEDMEEVSGKYDKWRPYPAQEPLSQYAEKMARKFSTKRGKFFEHIFRYTLWENIFWVEHAPASLAHVDRDAAMKNVDRILGKAMRVVRRKPAATFVFFSPYGPGEEPGFLVSSRLEPGAIVDWEGIRNYLNGKLDSDRDRPAG